LTKAETKATKYIERDQKPFFIREILEVSIKEFLYVSKSSVYKF